VGHDELVIGFAEDLPARLDIPECSLALRNLHQHGRSRAQSRAPEETIQVCGESFSRVISVVAEK